MPQSNAIIMPTGQFSFSSERLEASRIRYHDAKLSYISKRPFHLKNTLTLAVSIFMNNVSLQKSVLLL